MASNMLIFLLLMLVSFNSEALRYSHSALRLATSFLNNGFPTNSDDYNVPSLKSDNVAFKIPIQKLVTNKIPFHTLSSENHNAPKNNWQIQPNPSILDNYLKTRQPITLKYSRSWDSLNSAIKVNNAIWAPLFKQQRTKTTPLNAMPFKSEMENSKSGEPTPLNNSIMKQALLKLSIFYDNALESAKRFNSIAKKEWFKQRTKSVPSKTMPSNPEIPEKLKSSESKPSKYSTTSDSEYSLNSPRKESLKQQRTKSESAIEFEKQVDEYAKIQNKIKELKEQIDFLKELIAKNGKMEAIYEQIIKDYMDRKRSQLLCVMEKQNWHQARLGKLRSCRKKNAAQCCLNTQEMKADKFCPEVMAAYHEREFLEQLKEWHKRNFFIGDQFTKK